MFYSFDLLLPHAVNCERFCFWHLLSVVFCLYMKCLGNAERICAKFTQKTCLVHRSDESEGQWSRSPGTETAFSALSVVCVQFMFGKTSLASLA